MEGEPFIISAVKKLLNEGYSIKEIFRTAGFLEKEAPKTFLGSSL